MARKYRKTTNSPYVRNGFRRTKYGAAKGIVSGYGAYRRGSKYTAPNQSWWDKAKEFGSQAWGVVREVAPVAAALAPIAIAGVQHYNQPPKPQSTQDRLFREPEPWYNTKGINKIKRKIYKNIPPNLAGWVPKDWANKHKKNYHIPDPYGVNPNNLPNPYEGLYKPNWNMTVDPRLQYTSTPKQFQVPSMMTIDTPKKATPVALMRLEPKYKTPVQSMLVESPKKSTTTSTSTQDWSLLKTLYGPKNLTAKKAPVAKQMAEVFPYANSYAVTQKTYKPKLGQALYPIIPTKKPHVGQLSRASKKPAQDLGGSAMFPHGYTKAPKYNNRLGKHNLETYHLFTNQRYNRGEKRRHLR